MKLKNIYLYIALGIIAIFTLFYFITVNKISYAFSNNGETEVYNTVIKLINSSAKLYANSESDLFKDEKTIYITVDELIEKGFLMTDYDDKLFDPRDNSKTLNDLKIRITKNGDEIVTKVLL